MIRNREAGLTKNAVIQNALDIIDRSITEKILPRDLATKCGYSAFHFTRMFSRVANITLMAYVTRRKLQYALYDLAGGEKVIDVALKYGFETHAGFTRAFKKCFGYPPSLYRIHAICSRPMRMELSELKSIVSGGKMLYPEIINLKPFTVVGFTSRHKLPNVRATHDIPLYWETINLDYAQPLTRLHDLFNQSKHTEYTVCFNINAATDEFTYLLGVGVDNDADKAKIEPDMYVMQMPGGQYARFTTPLVKAEESTQNTRDTWNKIFEDWLPNSPYRFDEKRFDFEYYDERDHPWENNGMSQIEIFIPTSQR